MAKVELKRELVIMRSYSVDDLKQNNVEHIYTPFNQKATANIIMRSYNVDDLKQNNVEHIYTPFNQKATANILDAEWKGACNILAHSWMFRKIRLDNIKEVASYNITKSHLPHPVVIEGENAMTSQAITEIYDLLKNKYEFQEINQRKLDIPENVILSNTILESITLDKSIDNFLSYILSYKYHYGVVRASFSISEADAKLIEIDAQAFGHAVSFVKKDDAISWFDPDHGEITFIHSGDFRHWFKNETKYGVNKFIFNVYTNKQDFESLADIFSTPNFRLDDININENKLAEQVINIRLKNQENEKKVKSISILSYDIFSFFSDHYKKPDPLKEPEAVKLRSDRKTHCCIIS